MLKLFFSTLLCCLFLLGCGGDGGEYKAPVIKSKKSNIKITSINQDTSSEAVSNGYKEYLFTNSAGGNREYYIVLPDNYDSENKYKLMLIFSGTNQSAEAMHEWFGRGFSTDAPGFEKLRSDTIFVYPQATHRDPGGRLGWQLGPYSQNNRGNVDLQFVKELLTLLKSQYSIDEGNVYVTGHSWGGDMASVVGCFLGDQFRAVIPAGANEPHWFFDKDNAKYQKCIGRPAVWVFYGKYDEHFTKQGKNTNGENGYKQAEFWTFNNSCNRNSVIDIYDETKEYNSCELGPVRLTIYGPGQTTSAGSEPNHYPPDYFLSYVNNWINEFSGK